MDTATYNATALQHGAFLAHLDAIVDVFEQRPPSASKQTLLANLIALDGVAQSTLTGQKLDLALCVSDIARASVVFWYDRSEDWVIIADDDSDDGNTMGSYDPSKQVDGWDVLEADAYGAASGAALFAVGGLVTGGAMSGPGALWGAVSGGAASSAYEGGSQKQDAEAEEAIVRETPPDGGGGGEEDEEDGVGGGEEDNDNGESPAP